MRGRVLAGRAAGDPPGIDQSRKERIVAAGALLSDTVNAMFGLTSNKPTHLRIGTAWGLDRYTTDILRQALVLISDHELNPSTFAVRVCASTGASISAALLAGLTTLSGPSHGGVAANAHKTIEAEVSGDTAFLIEAKSKPYMHGFGHPIYPAGDVRATCLLDTLGPDTPAVRHVTSIAAKWELRPNIDAALAAFAMTASLPRDAAFLIFAVGRLAGWCAHAIEQLETKELIRPRADFTPI